MDYFEQQFIGRIFIGILTVIGCVAAMHKAAKGGLRPEKKPPGYFKSDLEKKLDALDEVERRK